MNKFINTKGATLLELMLVIAISIILVSSALPIFGNFQTTSQLNDTVEQIVQNIRIAKSRSITRLNDSAHGVYFQSDRFVVYQGSTYATRQAVYDAETVLAPPLTISTNFPGNEINFSKGMGNPSATGTIIVAHEISGSRNISINSFGVVDF